MQTTIELTTEFITLASLLKLAGAAESGGHAKQLILEGHVRVDGESETRRGAKIRPGSTVEVLVQPRLQIDVT
jgi:ribosome-associated protein